MERETGIEPATNSLEGCDSTTELLPPSRRAPAPRPAALLRASPRCSSNCTVKTPTGLPSEARALRARAKDGGEGRTRTFEAARATDLQSAAFDRFATSPAVCFVWKRAAMLPDVSAVLDLFGADGAGEGI